MARLPVPGSDDGKWGQILNEYLSQSLDESGNLKPYIVGTTHIKDGSITGIKIADGAVTKATVGLENVDNTSDFDKPISTATQEALDTKLTTAQLDTDTAQNVNNPESETATAITSKISSAVNAAVQPAKRVTMSLGAPVATTSTPANPNWAERIPVNVPLATVRWRLRVANTVASSGVAGSSPLTISDVVIGAAENPASGSRTTAAYKQTPTKVLDSFSVPTNGTDYVSPWVTGSEFQFKPGEIKLIGWFLTSPGGSSHTYKTSRYGFRHGSAGAAATLYETASTGYGVAGGICDIRVEYEFAGNNSVGLWVGGSVDEGVTSMDPNASTWQCSHWESWVGAASSKLGLAYVNAGYSGARQTAFSNASSRAYSRFDLTTTPPNFAVINLGGNSIALDGASALATQAEVTSVINTVRSLGINRIYLCTIQPGAVTGGIETERQAFNAWVRSVPQGVTGVIDIDLELRNPSATNALNPIWDNSADRIHFQRSGHQWLASHITIR